MVELLGEETVVESTWCNKRDLKRDQFSSGGSQISHKQYVMDRIDLQKHFLKSLEKLVMNCNGKVARILSVTLIWKEGFEDVKGRERGRGVSDECRQRRRRWCCC